MPKIPEHKIKITTSLRLPPWVLNAARKFVEKRRKDKDVTAMIERLLIAETGAKPPKE